MYDIISKISKILGGKSKIKVKKVVICVIIALLLVIFTQNVLAVEVTNNMDTEAASKIVDDHEKTQTEIDKYNQKYGESYGMTAYILNKIRLYSIPFCFIGMVVGALYQYVLGTRRLDMKHKGFGLIIAFTTLLVICQVLPLIFAIVVRGWGG